MTKGQKQPSCLCSHQACARSGYIHLPQQHRSRSHSSCRAGYHCKLSAAEEDRSDFQHLCAYLCPVHSPHSPWAPPRDTPSMKGTWEATPEQKLNYIALGFIMCLQVVAYMCLGVCCRNSRKTREGSKQAFDLTERQRKSLEVKNCLKVVNEKDVSRCLHPPEQRVAGLW